MRHLMIISALSTMCLLGSAHVATSQQAPAPTFMANDLAGEWEGQWQTPWASGALYVTIKKIDGDQVLGTIYIRGNAHYHNRDLTLTGTLRGNRLAGSFPTMPGSPAATYEWEIGPDGKAMTGWGEAAARSSISLKKKR